MKSASLHLPLRSNEAVHLTVNRKDPVLLHIRKSLANLESQMEEMRSLLQRDRNLVTSSPENTFAATPAYREQDA
jgi:hypothetical protein